MLKSGSGNIVNISTTMTEHANSSALALLVTLTKGGYRNRDELDFADTAEGHRRRLAT
jgi:hypothetical protein